MAIPVLEQIHKGRGIRRPHFASFLGPDLAAELHVFPDEDEPEEVVAKVGWQLILVIRRVPYGDPKWFTVLCAMYNVDQDPELNGLDLQRRLEVLGRRHGKGWELSLSTINSRLYQLRRDYIFPELRKGGFPWPEGQEFEELLRSEREYARLNESGLAKYTLPKDTLGLMIANRRGPGRGALDHLLPQVDLYFALSTRGNLVTTGTTEFGEILPVFTSQDLLTRYQEAVRAPAADQPTVAKGRTVIERLVTYGRVGLAVNPLGGHGTEVGECWAPEDLVGL